MKTRAEINNEVLLTRGEVADFLGVGPATVLRLVARGRLPPPVRLSRRCHRWRRSELLGWLTEGGSNKGG